MRTVEAGHLLDEPIPEIHFVSCPGSNGRKMIDKCLAFISHRESPWSASGRFVERLAWSLAVSREIPAFDDATEESLYRTFNLEPLLLEPIDYLGEMRAERRCGGWNPHACLPTPHSVVELMVQMTLGHQEHGETKLRRLANVLDPALGTGRMLSGNGKAIHGA